MTVESSVAGFILGVILVGIISNTIYLNVKSKFQHELQTMLISECEKALPRNQKCVIVLSTRIENVEEKSK